MRYYKGDIVEILNGRADIGSRHIVSLNQEDNEDFVCLCTERRFVSSFVSLIQVTLYKRPLINWLKYIWWLIRK